ncbi:hypothetical protein K8R43_03040 [archaeon]|nr:hypothetical protein [archaeon]
MAKAKKASKKKKKGFNTALLLIPLGLIAIIVIALIGFSVIALLIMPSFFNAPERRVGTGLQMITRDASANSTAIAYADLEKVLNNEQIREEAGIPDLHVISFIFGYGGFILTEEQPIMIVESKPLELILKIAPPVSGIFSGLSKDIPKIDERSFRGEKIYVTNNMSYWTNNNRIVIGEPVQVKKFINTRGKNAGGNFNSMISKLEERDVMFVFQIDEQQQLGVTAWLKEDTADALILLQLPDENTARLYKTMLGALKLDGINIKSSEAQGNILKIEADAKIAKLKDLSNLPSQIPSQGTPTGDNNMTNGTLPPDLPVEELFDEFKPEELPCEGIDNCQDYCLQNPEECGDILENYTSSPCCTECIKAFVGSGYGLEGIGMQCSDFDLGDCNSYFTENPTTIMSCYEG